MTIQELILAIKQLSRAPGISPRPWRKGKDPNTRMPKWTDANGRVVMDFGACEPYYRAEPGRPPNDPDSLFLEMAVNSVESLVQHIDVVEAERDLWSGEECRKGIYNGLGPCGACRNCLPVIVNDLRKKCSDRDLILDEMAIRVECHEHGCAAVHDLTKTFSGKQCSCNLAPWWRSSGMHLDTERRARAREQARKSGSEQGQ